MKEKELAIKSRKTTINSDLNKNQIRSVDLAIEKGASSCLNTMSLKRYHFDLTKSELRDGIGLRYGWDPVMTPYYAHAMKSSLVVLYLCIIFDHTFIFCSLEFFH